MQKVRSRSFAVPQFGQAISFGPSGGAAAVVAVTGSLVAGPLGAGLDGTAVAAAAAFDAVVGREVVGAGGGGSSDDPAGAEGGAGSTGTTTVGASVDGAAGAVVPSGGVSGFVAQPRYAPQFVQNGS